MNHCQLLQWSGNGKKKKKLKCLKLLWSISVIAIPQYQIKLLIQFNLYNVFFFFLHKSKAKVILLTLPVKLGLNPYVLLLLSFWSPMLFFFSWRKWSSIEQRTVGYGNKNKEIMGTRLRQPTPHSHKHTHTLTHTHTHMHTDAKLRVDTDKHSHVQTNTHANSPLHNYTWHKDRWWSIQAHKHESVMTVLWKKKKNTPIPSRHVYPRNRH